ncbi:chemotaxis protein CheB [Candidatus Woesearchaeota archaeon]|nr:chemotaxis protein CheB [Candidatus Woesearchaeota archaeon]
MDKTRTQLYNGSVQPVLAVLIGQSTGFPNGLDALLGHLSSEADKIMFPKETLPLSVIVAVHHEPYIDGRVGELSCYCNRLQPKLLEDGMKVGRNGVYFCQGRKKTGIDKYHSFAEVQPQDGSFGPNIDFLFITAADYFKRHCPSIPIISVILSGNEYDGARGALYAIRPEKSLLLVQDPEQITKGGNSMPLQTLERLIRVERGESWEHIPDGILPTEHTLRDYKRLDAVRNGKVIVTVPEKMGPIIIRKMRENL